MKRVKDNESLKDPGEDVRDLRGNEEMPDAKTCADEGVEAGEVSEVDPEVLLGELIFVKELAERLEKENRTLQEAAARARADFFNFRQRVEREQERSRQLASESAALLFIPVLDNLDRALSSPQGDFDSFLKGVEMVRVQFFSALQGIGVSLIETTGRPFDPAFHEAVAIDESAEDVEEGAVTEEIQSGYMIAGKILRAARVKVARGSS